MSLTAAGVCRPDSHGTCYSACECNQDDCKYSDRCTQFLCDTGYRQRNDENDCVEDLCKGVSHNPALFHAFTLLGTACFAERVHAVTYRSKRTQHAMHLSTKGFMLH